MHWTTLLHSASAIWTNPYEGSPGVLFQPTGLRLFPSNQSCAALTNQGDSILTNQRTSAYISQLPWGLGSVLWKHTFHWCLGKVTYWLELEHQRCLPGAEWNRWEQTFEGRTMAEQSCPAEEGPSLALLVSCSYAVTLRNCSTAVLSSQTPVLPTSELFALSKVASFSAPPKFQELSVDSNKAKNWSINGRLKVMGMNVFTVKFFQLFPMLKNLITKYIIIVTINIKKLSPTLLLAKISKIWITESKVQVFQGF